MTLRLPQLGESLCGCSLKTASKIIGWICVVLSIFFLWFLIVMLCNCDTRSISKIFGIDLVEEERCSMSHFLGEGRCSCTTFNVAPNFVKGLALLVATSLMVSTIFNSLLLVGIYNNRPNFIHAWIVALMFGIFVDLITVVSSLIEEPFNPFLRLFIICINVYCLLIVNSYHCSLKQGRTTAIIPPPSYED